MAKARREIEDYTMMLTNLRKKVRDNIATKAW